MKDESTTAANVSADVPANVADSNESGANATDPAKPESDEDRTTCYSTSHGAYIRLDKLQNFFIDELAKKS